MGLAIEILLIGAIVILGIIWQFKLFENDYDFPQRNKIPLGISVVLLVGLIIRGIIAICIDSQSQYAWIDFGGDFIKALALSISFNIKAFFGPIFLAFTISTSIYFLFEYGNVQTWSFVRSFLYWVFSEVPSWIRSLYTIGSFIIVVGGCIADSGDYEFDFFD